MQCTICKRRLEPLLLEGCRYWHQALQQPCSTCHVLLLCDTPVCNKVVLPACSTILALQDGADNVVQMPGRALLCRLQCDFQGCGGVEAGTFHSEAVHLQTVNTQGRNGGQCRHTSSLLVCQKGQQLPGRLSLPIMWQSTGQGQMHPLAASQ